ncbi:MAG: Adaptive-response sensory-kinase SasA [Gemmatimonadaceae bacterium]|nr:Adaptive-response sensory-kinase SasA [Gemmatimonadaceae bacterium]
MLGMTWLGHWGVEGRQPSRTWRWAFLAGQTVFLVLASVSQTREEAFDRDPVGFDRALRADAVAELTDAVSRSMRDLQSIADRAVAVPAGSTGRFAELRSLVAGSRRGGERGVVLLEDNRATAWAGVMRSPSEQLPGRGGVDFTTFYATLYAVAERSGRRAVAVELLHAEAPGNALGRALDRDVAGRVGIRDFDVVPGGRDTDGWVAVPVAGQSTVSVRPLALSTGEARLRIRARFALVAAIALVAVFVCFLVTAWRRPAALSQRLLSLLAVVATIAILPLPSFSNVTRLFDASVYFASFGGPLTASVGALSLTSGLVLVGFFAVQRSRLSLARRWMAIVVVLAVASLGPFLLRDLARGIAPPPRGVTTTLWLAWQVALFLVGSALLLAGASAGRIALGARRGLSPWVGPAIAALTALFAPPLWQAPGQWPGWYPVPWVLAMGALALSRRTRALVVAAAIVSACGATTLVWGAAARMRVELAERDIERLSRVDSTALQLMERLSRELTIRTAPIEREDLLQRYVRSDLASAEYPVELSSWLPGATQPYASLRIANFEHEREKERTLVTDARAAGRPLIRQDSTTYGIQLTLAVPHDDDGVTTVVVAPRTLLIPDDPYMSLLGLGGDSETEPPYKLTLTTLDERSALGSRPGWQREGTGLHGDASVAAATRPSRVHLEVDLRGLDALVPRGALIVLLDLIILSALWTLSAAADGGLGRWLRRRAAAFGRSYRARLTLTLFSFFVLPAIVFAWWSYLRLQSSDRQSRELLIRETLRTIVATGDPLALAYESGRLSTPLLLYTSGSLRATSDPLYDRLSPVGRYLPPSVARVFMSEDEVDASERVAVGQRPRLFGYRAILGFGEARGAVLAAPARINEVELDRQRRDLGVLVLFSVAVGALAALWLSGLAAGELERPIGALREAALAIARGARHPVITSGQPAEFGPVFSAFRRMDDDLAASREALEAAQRRTETVLRNVASGVIATGGDGRVMVVNPRAEQLLGRALAIGGSVDTLAPATLAARIRAFLASDQEYAAFDAELRGRHLRCSLTRLTKATGGAVLTLDDVTEVARAQRVLAWGEMARQVAHEIKNPLTPIRLGVQHLRRARLDRRIDFERIFEQNVSRILAEIDRLDEIARAFSHYGMAPAERLPAYPVDLTAVVNDVVELERMGEGGIDWRLTGFDGPHAVLATPDELREVFLNVFENARLAQATSVEVQLFGGGERTHVDIRDDGVGIPAEVLPRIFEPHFSTRTSGSGLGLAICRGLVRSWGGEMSVQSTVGEGTTVRLALVAAPRA